MYMIVIGAGRVGYHLTRALLEEGHEVLVVEQNIKYVEIMNNELGSVCVHGDGCEATTLAETGTGRADMFIAVTGDDEDNLVSCQVAKHKFNVRRTIARIRNPRNEVLFKKLGIDVTVSSTDIILEHIEEEVPTHPLTHLFTFGEKGLEIVELKVPPEATTVGKSIGDIILPEESQLIMVLSEEHEPRLAAGNIVIQPGDKIIALTKPESEEKLRAALRGS